MPCVCGIEPPGFIRNGVSYLPSKLILVSYALSSVKLNTNDFIFFP